MSPWGSQTLSHIPPFTEGQPSSGDGPEACVVNFPGGFSQSATCAGWGSPLEGRPLVDSTSEHPPWGLLERREDAWRAGVGAEGPSGRSPRARIVQPRASPGGSCFAFFSKGGDGFCWGVILSPCRQQPNSRGTFRFLPLRSAKAASDYTWKYKPVFTYSSVFPPPPPMAAQR